MCLDTQVFVAENFGYHRHNFATLADWVRRGRLRVVITDVIDGEVRSHIAKRLRAAQQAIRGTSGSTAILLNHDALRELVRSKNTALWDDAERDLLAQYERFLGDVPVEVVDTGAVPTGAIMDRYRRVVPPFETGEDKKFEFPDAISIEGLAVWSQAEGERVYFVSGDAGARAACAHVSHPDALLALEALAELLAMVTAAEADTPTNPAVRAFARVEDEAASRLGEAFEDAGFFLEDQEGDVSSVEVDNVAIEAASLVNLERADAGRWRATFGLQARVEYQAHVSYDDPAAVKWDEGERYVFNTIETTLERSEDLTATATLVFDPADPESEVEIEDVDAGLARSVGVTIDEDDW